MDVLLQRSRVAVVEVEAGRLRLELIGEAPSGLDDLEDAVHVRRMDAVEVDRVRMRSGVHEVHAQAIAFGSADHRAGRCAVVDPGWEEDTRRDLQLHVGRGERVLANPSRLVRKRRWRIEKRVEILRARPPQALRRRSSPRGPWRRAGDWRACARGRGSSDRCALAAALLSSANLPTRGTAASGAAAASNFPLVRRVLAMTNSESECNLRAFECQRSPPTSPSPSRTT